MSALASPTISTISSNGGLTRALATPFFPHTTSAGVIPFRKIPTLSSQRFLSYAISGRRTEEYIDVIQNGFPLIKWPEIVEDDTQKETYHEDVEGKTRGLVESIRLMMKSMEDGEISASPYDTAWVALVEDIGGSGTPQFPTSLKWIANNQHSDGSWGDGGIFHAYDRIINTLACVIALRTWNMHPDKSDKGIVFVKENIYKLQDEKEEHMPIGFEVALPSLIEIAKKLDIDIPDDSHPALQQIYAKRDIKLAKIPKDILHKVPTTLLHSLEGMDGLDWKKLLNLQSSDGSFLFSPSSTAFALRQSKDPNCLQYLAKLVQKFNGGVPNVYPVDLFEHIWVVDRLQRLGISRYYESEIEECMDYVNRFWTSKGICWARNSEVQDVDDTAMAFRLLRLHGYNISADVFNHFKNGEKFFCFAGQSTQAVTGMYNLYRASQVKFPGEEVLAEATVFATKFLQQKRADNELLDKWIITKDLPGEVRYALDVPWYASLPRVETRFFLEQYGGEEDVWIGKSLYRMPYVNNNTYLELAKLDYNNCQNLHQQEWKKIQRWYKNWNFGEVGLSETRLLQTYYLAAASVFEPENTQQRIAWAKTAILMETISCYYDRKQLVGRDQKRAFVNEFELGEILKFPNRGRDKTRNSLVGTLLRTINQLSLDTLLAHGRDIHQQLHHAWQKWIGAWSEEGYNGQKDAELLVSTLSLTGNSSNWVSVEPQYQELLEVTNRVCHLLRLFYNRKIQETNGGMTDMGGITTMEIESDMQKLVKLVLTKTEGNADSQTKQNFLAVAKSFYYAAYCNPGTVNFHIAKVLFERVL